jgi:hypothetical protein
MTPSSLNRLWAGRSWISVVSWPVDSGLRSLRPQTDLVVAILGFCTRGRIVQFLADLPVKLSSLRADMTQSRRGAGRTESLAGTRRVLKLITFLRRHRSMSHDPGYLVGISVNSYEYLLIIPVPLPFLNVLSLSPLFSPYKGPVPDGPGRRPWLHGYLRSSKSLQMDLERFRRTL